jgi:hypothetical protein
MTFTRRIAMLLVWGIAFGFVESSVVVYLRAIYYPEGFHFPLAPMDERLMLNELVREAATLVLLWTTAALAYTRLQSRVAAFFFLFGVWDIFYYVFLKVVLDWPDSPADWDILFLIPLPWAGPVWSPVAVALFLVAAGGLVLYLNHEGRYPRFDGRFVVTELVAATLIVSAFILSGLPLLKAGGMPAPLPLWLYLPGFGLGIAAFVTALRRV